MKVHRWIYAPLVFILLYLIMSVFIRGETFYFLFLGAVVGFITLLVSDFRARQISGRNDEEIYRARQQRTVETLFSRKRTLELCREAINSLPRGKIKKEISESGSIRAKARIQWWGFGNQITIKVKKITEHSSEVKISVRPIPRTILIGDGEAWKLAEEISDFLKQANVKAVQKQLNARLAEKVDFSSERLKDRR